MDLTIRLQILRDAGQISTEVYEGIVRIIEAFERDLSIKLTEKNGAMLVTHVAIALERIKKGEIVEGIDAALYEEIRNNSRFAEAKNALGLMEDTLKIDIPENEKTFIMMHLCALLEGEAN